MMKWSLSRCVTNAQPRVVSETITDMALTITSVLIALAQLTADPQALLARRNHQVMILSCTIQRLLLAMRRQCLSAATWLLVLVLKVLSLFMLLSIDEVNAAKSVKIPNLQRKKTNERTFPGYT